MNFKNHHLYKIWDKVPVTYYQAGVRKNLFQRFWHLEKIKLATSLIKKIKFNNCLDVGCASGYMLSELAKEFPNKKYFGVDIYNKAITFAKKTYPGIYFRVADMEKLPYKNDFFDLIINYETIEHVENPTAALKELRRVLKDNGTVILAMDSGSFLFRLVWFIWENSKGKVWKGAHLHPFTHDELEKQITESGLKVKEKIFSHLGMEVTFVLSK